MKKRIARITITKSDSKWSFEIRHWMKYPPYTSAYDGIVPYKRYKTQNEAVACAVVTCGALGLEILEICK